MSADPRELWIAHDLEPDALPRVSMEIRRTPMSAGLKRRTLREWADYVGVSLTPVDYARVVLPPGAEGGGQ